MIISPSAIEERETWIKNLQGISGNFGADVDRVETTLRQVLQINSSPSALINHLRLCGDIPESFEHDSSEEKLYSKYTDILLSHAFDYIGLRSLVIRERADAADVEVVGSQYSFVADAKAFRLSRTAKNQKDFKVQAMDGWKRGKPYAMVVCPIYQLPIRASQIYQQATVRNVCIFTYSHIVLLLKIAESLGADVCQDVLHKVFNCIPALNPSKDAGSYWRAINTTMLGIHESIPDLWQQEKKAATEALDFAKDMALQHLALEREKIMRMSHHEAINELVRVRKIDSRIQVIESVTDNHLLEIN